MRRLSRTLLAIALGACTADSPESTRAARVEPGAPMPAYAAPTLAGDTVSLAQLRGSAVLLNIWATWCPPCRDEMPSFQRLHRDFEADGLRIVAVSVDNRAAADAVRSFVADYGITFTILHDPDDSVSRVMRTIGVPETFLVDRDGTLRRRWIGKVDADAEAFRSEVRAALASRP